MTAPLHIAHAVLSLDVGGLERIVLSLARVMGGRGHRVSVVCVERPGTLAAEAEAAGVRVASLDKPPGRLPAFVDKAERVLAELKPDVVHTHQIGAAWYVGPAARRAGRTPVLHSEHGNEFARGGGWVKTIKTRLLIYQTARSIDRFCCVSDEIARGVTRWGTVPRGKIEVVPNGIPTDPPRPDLQDPAAIRAALGIPAEALVVGTVGRLAEVKRQDLLIRAVAKVRQTVPNVHLLLVGDGPEQGRLESAARDLGLSSHAHFVGYQSRPEDYLHIMDVFALTSRSEGFPVSLLEAWLAGVPVVASAVGGIPQVVSDGSDAVLFPSGDEAALARSLTRLLGDNDRRSRLACEGSRVVRERYSLARMADEYESRYRSLIAVREGGRSCASWQ